MRSRLRTPLVRLALLALLAATVGALAPTTAGPASAATMVRECKASSVACISFSGYAGKSVWGYPVSSTGNNCVNYAAYRLAKNGVTQQSAMGNGGSWATSAKSRGYRVDKTPAVGSIAQWNYGSTYAPSYGHVGYVEEVTSTYIVISDSAWSGYSSRWRVPTGDANWPSNFIHFKDVAYQPPPSSTFVRVRETNQVFRLVGKAPIYVSTWTPFGGTQPTHLISSTTLAALPLRPANGTLIKGAQRGEVYLVAGGAPLYVSAFANIGGYRKPITVDQVAIDKAGTSTVYNHLAYQPVDGVYLKAAVTGNIYSMSGGVARLLTSWTQVGGVKPTSTVDHVTVANAGITSPVKWAHLRGTARY